MQNPEIAPIPYNFLVDEDYLNTFAFTTDYQLVYEVRFKFSGYIFAGYPDLEPNVFELLIRLVANQTGKRTPTDLRIAATVADIFKLFLARHERVVVYVCESSDRRQMARARKFDGWFEYYRGPDYLKIDRNIVDPSGDAYLTSLIMRHDNPNKIRLFDAFDRLISGQNEAKPE